jgi:copper chaperone CopZ
MKVKRLYSILLLSALLILLAGAIQQTHAEMRIVEVRIPGCVCENTYTDVRIIVSRMPGVKSVETLEAAQKAKIEFDDAVISLDKIKEELQVAGHPIVGKPNWIK